MNSKPKTLNDYFNLIKTMAEKTPGLHDPDLNKISDACVCLLENGFNPDLASICFNDLYDENGLPIEEITFFHH